MRWCLRRPDSLKGRILRDIGLGLLLAAAVQAVALTVLYRAGSEALVHNGLSGQAEDLVDHLSAPGGVPRMTLHDTMHWGYDAYFRHLKYRVLDLQGRVLLSSELDRHALARTGDHVRLAPDRFASERHGVMLQAVTLPVEVDGHRFWIQAARSDKFLQLAEEAILPVVVDTAILACATALACFALFAWHGLHRALAPVRDASGAARAIGPDNASARLASDAMPSEIRPLAEAVNAGLARLEAGYRVQQRFLANAAHELKTPLTILRGRLELEVASPARRAALSEIDGMSRIVGQLLMLAEAADPGSYRRATVSLPQVAMRACALVAFVAEVRGVRFDVVLHESQTFVDGDEGALTTAVRNLLENAIRHSPRGGVVDIAIEADVLCVRDRGPGLPQGAEDLVFERFWRADRTGDGAGLGLSIVREVMQAHGGTASACNRKEGTGAEFRLAFNRGSGNPTCRSR
jgi:two-component system, OmpR family, sensor histidine kinase QseC